MDGGRREDCREVDVGRKMVVGRWMVGEWRVVGR